VVVLWHGVLLRDSEAAPNGADYWARAPLETGHAFILAGCEKLPRGHGSEAWVTGLLDAPANAELVIYADPGLGAFRYASIVDGRLSACLLLARTAHALPATTALAALLGTDIAAKGREELLACAIGGIAAAND